VREDLGRELNFLDGRSYFDRTLKIFRELAEVNLDAVPFSQLQNLTNIAQQTLQQFNVVRGFTIQQYAQNPVEARTDIVNKIQSHYDKVFNAVAPIVSYYAKNKEGVDHLEEKAQTAVEHLNEIISEQEKSRTSMLADIESTLEKVKRAAQEAGVAQHAVHFKQEAEDHKKAADKWLVTTGILIAITLGLGYLSLSYLIEKLPTLNLTQSIQLTVAKIVVFSLLFTAIVWSGRIYRAHRHNYVVNKHRQNALSTFETFVKAANDEQTKSAVLLQTTNCIFSPQHTGYIAHEQESAGYPQILEIIRGMAGPQGKT
jgi:hypothetical protein